jgi:hypothetical protein
MLFYRSDARWYTIELNRDLLGDLVVLCRWGGNGKKASGTKKLPANDLAQARIIMRELQQTRRVHGYCRVPARSPSSL